MAVPCPNNHTKKRPKLSGGKHTKKLAIQSAYNSALRYLEDGKYIMVDNYNAHNVSQMREEKLYAESWSMLFEYKATKLSQIARTNKKKLEDIVSSLDTLCHDACAAVPLSHKGVEIPPPRKKTRCRKEICERSSAPSASKLHEAIQHIRDDLLRLVAEMNEST